MARKFGITTPIPPYPSIHIGSADVYPIEMVAAYSAFATLGVRAVPTAILASRTRRATMLWEPTPARYAGAVARRGVAHGRHDEGRRAPRQPRPACGRRASTFPPAERRERRTTAPTSGSSATPPISSPGVWMGFDRPQKIKSNAQGGVLAAPAWTAFMTEVYQRRPRRPTGRAPRGSSLRESRSQRRACSGIRSVPDSRRHQRVLHRGHRARCASAPCTVRARHLIAGDFRILGTARSAARCQPDHVTASHVPRAAPVPQPSRAQATRVARTLRSVPSVQAVTSWTPIDCHAHTTMSDGALTIRRAHRDSPRARRAPERRRSPVHRRLAVR